MGIIGTSRSYEVSVVYFAYRSHIAEPLTVIKELHLKEKHLLCSLWLEGSYLLTFRRRIFYFYFSTSCI
jgi:hypothetical protein